MSTPNVNESSSKNLSQLIISTNRTPVPKCDENPPTGSFGQMRVKYNLRFCDDFYSDPSTVFDA